MLGLSDVVPLWLWAWWDYTHLTIFNLCFIAPLCKRDLTVKERCKTWAKRFKAVLTAIKGALSFTYTEIKKNFLEKPLKLCTPTWKYFSHVSHLENSCLIQHVTLVGCFIMGAAIFCLLIDQITTTTNTKNNVFAFIQCSRHFRNHKH